MKKAVQSYCGGLNPDEDAMFELDKDSVTASLFEKVTKYA